jgi:pyrroline-5-carboxylate reductase
MATNVLLAGCGNMGFAMLTGWLKSGQLKPGDVYVVEPNEALRQRAGAQGVHVFSDAGATAGRAETLTGDLCGQAAGDARRRARLQARFKDKETAFLSIAAGTGVKVFEDILGGDAAIVRCMPNTPAAVGKGMMVTFANPNVSAAQRAFVAELLATSGKVATIDDERLMDAVTAVSGSGPAYVFHFIECLTAAGEAAGLPSDTAKLLAMQTVYGAGALAAASDDPPGRLREQVTSPGGTTAAALGVLMGEDRLKKLLTEAVDAARKRSIELG